MTLAAPDDAAVLAQPFTLPCGVTLKNRLAKASMSDSLGDGQGRPTPEQARLYERWAEGGTALSLIGEVQGDPHAAEKPGNLVMSEDADPAPFRDLARRGTRDGAHLWCQLGHAGALAHAPIADQRGPSDLVADGVTARAMSRAEIAALPSRIAATARRAQEAGFTGVQVHAAHGFLLSQFLSPLFNRREDAYGGPVANRARLLIEVVEAVRDAVGAGFPVGLKLNATDELDGGLTAEDALEVIGLLEGRGVDLLDISGGTYFPGAAPLPGKRPRGAWFAEFARQARGRTATPLMLTGGIKTRDQAAVAIRGGAADMVGLARALVLRPDLPNAWLSGPADDPVFPRFAETPPGAVTAWYTLRLTDIGSDRDPALAEPDAVAALARYDARDAARVAAWHARFGLPGQAG